MTGILDPAILSEVTLFRDLHSEQLSKLAARRRQRTFPSGANLITAEERGELADTNTRSLAALDVHGRVAAQLLAFAREYGEPLPDGGTLIPLRLTQTDLAGLVGASRVRVNQALGYYRKQGSISLDKDHRIIVRDEESLARRAR